MTIGYSQCMSLTIAWKSKRSAARNVPPSMELKVVRSLLYRAETRSHGSPMNAVDEELNQVAILRNCGAQKGIFLGHSAPCLASRRPSSLQPIGRSWRNNICTALFSWMCQRSIQIRSCLICGEKLGKVVTILASTSAWIWVSIWYYPHNISFQTMSTNNE